MEDLILVVQQRVPTDVLIGLMIASIAGFIGSLIAIPWILIRLPSDYFDLRVPRYWMKDHHPALRLIGLIVKNIAGTIFLIAGFLMLFLPGQGLLTMLIGISFIDFPGKRQLEVKIIRQPAIFNAVNVMRHKFNKPRFTLS